MPDSYKNMKSNFFVIVMLFLFSHEVKSQYVNCGWDNAMALKNKTILVGLEEVQQSTIAYFKNDTNYLHQYRSEIEGLNEALKKVVKTHWTYSQNPEFMPLSEARKLLKENKGKYAIVHFEEKENDVTYTPSRKLNGDHPIVGWSKHQEKWEYNYNLRDRVKSIVVNKLVLDAPKTIIEVYLPKRIASLGDLAFGIQHMQYLLNSLSKKNPTTEKILFDRAIQTRASLARKTLMIDRKETRLGFTEIQNFYSYKIKMVNYQEIENAVLLKDTSVAFITLSKFDETNSAHYISNAGTGAVYFFGTSPTYDYSSTKGGGYIKYTYPGIREGDFEEYFKDLK
jgi:hypothetical protein